MLHFEPFMCRVMKESQMQTTEDSKWSYKVNLAKYPTEPNNLHINIDVCHEPLKNAMMDWHEIQRKDGKVPH